MRASRASAFTGERSVGQPCLRGEGENMKKIKKAFIFTYLAYAALQLIAVAISVYDGGRMINKLMGEELIFPYVSLAVRGVLNAAWDLAVCAIILFVLYTIIKRVLQYTPYALDGKDIKDVL